MLVYSYSELSQSKLDLVKLNLGCGDFPLSDYLNVDVRPEAKCDLVKDLNEKGAFDDLPKGKFTHINLFHCLEHLDDVFRVMCACHEALAPGGVLRIRVPHFSRGLTNTEHKRGFDVGFPYYFDNKLPSFYYGPTYELVSLRLDWAIRFDIYSMVIPMWQISVLKFLNGIFTFFANLSPGLCSRLWCFWVGGFEQIEYVFKKPI